MFVPLTEQKLKRIIYNKIFENMESEIIKTVPKNLTKNRTAETQKKMPVDTRVLINIVHLPISK